MSLAAYRRVRLAGYCLFKQIDHLDPELPMVHDYRMQTERVKADLQHMADHLPDSASYADAMYELYVRMKVAIGRKAAGEGRLLSHDEVRAKFAQ